MPIPILAAAACGLLVGGGATAIYQGCKHKKEIARLQERIYQLQQELEESHLREKELIIKINQLQKEKAALLSKISELTDKEEALKNNIQDMYAQIERNNRRWKRFVYMITLRLRKLEQENAYLRDQLNALINEKEKVGKTLNGAQLHLVKREEQATILNENLNETRLTIMDLEAQIDELNEAC